MAFLALDATLGEHDVELWIGEVSASEISPVDGFGLRALRAVVRDHTRAKVDEDGRPSWILMQGDTPQGPLIAAAQVPLHPATAPHLGTHVAVLLPYRHRTPEGLPADASLSALREFEDGLSQAMGTDGQVVAHQSSNGTRVLHRVRRRHLRRHAPSEGRGPAVARGQGARAGDGRPRLAVCRPPAGMTRTAVRGFRAEGQPGSP